jgi:hypothetical protein
VKIDEVKDKQQIKIYPNPANKAITIENLDSKTKKSVIVKDLLGRAILSKFIGDVQYYYLSMEELKNGLYIISIVSQDNKIIFQKKISKQD